MAIYEEIFAVSAPALSKSGYLVLELGQRPDEIIALSRPLSWHLEQVHRDLAGKLRCAVFSPPG
jgi:methylase of polypeptide subunit release factors